MITINRERESDKETFYLDFLLFVENDGVLQRKRFHHMQKTFAEKYLQRNPIKLAKEKAAVLMFMSILEVKELLLKTKYYIVMCNLLE